MEASWSPLLSIKSKRNGSYNEPLEPLMKAELERPFSLIRSGTEYDIHKSMHVLQTVVVPHSVVSPMYIFVHLSPPHHLLPWLPLHSFLSRYVSSGHCSVLFGNC